MFLPYKYSFLLGTFLFFVVWVILFLHRKDLRKEMLIVSVLAAVGSFLTGYWWWTKDWWHPETITGTVVGIEDLILGFTNGGIVAAVYEEVFKKRLYKRKSNRPHSIGGPLLIVALLAIVFVFFNVIGLSSFYSSVIAMSSVGLMLVLTRKDLLIDALASASLMVLVVIPIYFFLEFLSPGLINHSYYHENLSGIRLFVIPIEELVFYFLFGFLGGPFYEYWKGLSLRKSRS